MKKYVYRGDHLDHIEHAEPVCEEDFCDRCGDCLACATKEEPCYAGTVDGAANGKHLWVEYEDDSKPTSLIVSWMKIEKVDPPAIDGSTHRAVRKFGAVNLDLLSKQPLQDTSFGRTLLARLKDPGADVWVSSMDAYEVNIEGKEPERPCNSRAG